MSLITDDRKTVLITGSGGGIGRTLVKSFASAGFDVIAHKRKPDEVYSAWLADLVQKTGISAREIYFDMTDSEAVKAEVSQLIKAKVYVDVLINNAGVAHGGLFQMTPIKKIREVFETNIFSQMELTQLILRQMTRRGQGVIINIASIAGLDLKAGNSAYGVSKAALIAWTKTLAAETGSLGIRVNAIAPGLTDTRMAGMMEDGAGKSMIADSAMNRLAQPEEIADVAVYLASDQARFINGQVLRVDGGSK